MLGLLLGQFEEHDLQVGDLAGDLGGVQRVAVCDQFGGLCRGQNPGGIESGSAIMALQEAAQTRIRMKVKIYEYALGELGQEWLERIKQFWKFDRLVPVKKPTANPTLAPAGQAMPGADAMAPQNPMAPPMPEIF